MNTTRPECCRAPCRVLLEQVHELQALRQQLEPEVEIPQLQPLRDEVERLDELLQSLSKLQVGGVFAVTVQPACRQLAVTTAHPVRKSVGSRRRGWCCC